MNSDTLKVSLNNGIAQIEINRPEKKNALTQAMYAAMADALAQADNNPAVRVVLIHGQSNVFTSGNDLQDFMKFNSDEPFESGAIFRFLRGISGAAKPIIAPVVIRAATWAQEIPNRRSLSSTAASRCLERRRFQCHLLYHLTTLARQSRWKSAYGSDRATHPIRDELMHENKPTMGHETQTTNRGVTGPTRWQAFRR